MACSLNRRRNGVALIGDRAQQRLGQPERGKRHESFRMGARPFAQWGGQSQPNGRNYGGRNRLRQGDWNKRRNVKYSTKGAALDLHHRQRGKAPASSAHACDTYVRRRSGAPLRHSRVPDDRRRRQGDPAKPDRRRTRPTRRDADQPRSEARHRRCWRECRRNAISIPHTGLWRDPSRRTSVRSPGPPPPPLLSRHTEIGETPRATAIAVREIYSATAT